MFYRWLAENNLCIKYIPGTGWRFFDGFTWQSQCNWDQSVMKEPVLEALEAAKNTALLTGPAENQLRSLFA